VRIGVVGGGPAGLYFALLMRSRHPDHAVVVVEQNPPDATYGWGVVFSSRALGFLRASSPPFHADLAARLCAWGDQVIVHRGQRVVIDGLAFAGIARLELLRLLQEHCRRAGVELEFGRRLTDLDGFGACDLVVGADGVHSLVRELHGQHFQPRVELLGNRYIWYGTAQPFEALTLTFRESDHGPFVAHHYPYGGGASTFIVECDAGTWERAGFARMSDEASRAYCEALFAADLGGQPLLTNRSQWLRFPLVTNGRWAHDRVVLIGDALRTVHFSIGSGTRTALEDAVALADALATSADVPAALRTFERVRRPPAEEFLTIAARSGAWYERFADRFALDPLPFAHSYLVRGGHIPEERLRARFPRFAGAYAAWARAQGGEVSDRRA
jgi:2-polyprenyl-6-methoxyphenol hydroxylase-like FAD-dependent oxidoreductase